MTIFKFPPKFDANEKPRLQRFALNFMASAMTTPSAMIALWSIETEEKREELLYTTDLPRGYVEIFCKVRALYPTWSHRTIAVYIVGSWLTSFPEGVFNRRGSSLAFSTSGPISDVHTYYEERARSLFLSFRFKKPFETDQSYRDGEGLWLGW